MVCLRATRIASRLSDDDFGDVRCLVDVAVPCHPVRVAARDW